KPLYNFIFKVQQFSKNITALPGQNVTLPCQAANNNKPIIVAEWSRPDLGDEYVLQYRDERFDPENQHPSFKNRVDLQDRQMKDGDVSLILKDVTFNDTATYECRVVQRGTNRRKRADLKTEPISTITLRVVAPPGEAASWLLMFVSADTSHLLPVSHQQVSQQEAMGMQGRRRMDLQISEESDPVPLFKKLSCF
uniref:Ig-like domain-containing protein n=1 Tax=Amphilophus citrinellus TaxID=61819 RepID=A0A3Q0SX49_AMPCI